ncbi:thiamine phosphate synthase [Sediminibacillus massiliensis]|uniref:thiamine phosphate synthase n=1 Tax=Sediminibacillus massiliensis TaxID=1926277 RepID=UPI0009888A7A|nr:thiamine phosphate synthase [Sediminibacillus massiliensis]
MDKKLHIVTTGRQSAGELSRILGAIHPYIDAIHVREKERTSREIYYIVNRLTDQGVPSSKIIINDRADIALATKVSGVHLGHQSLPAAVMKRRFPSLCAGASVHSVDEALFAQGQGVDYLLFGHVFSTGSKPGLPPKGLCQLERAVSAVETPVIAIGGVKPENMKETLETGVEGVAVMSGVLEAADPVAAVQSYGQYLNKVV